MSKITDLLAEMKKSWSWLPENYIGIPTNEYCDGMNCWAAKRRKGLFLSISPDSEQTALVAIFVRGKMTLRKAEWVKKEQYEPDENGDMQLFAWDYTLNIRRGNISSSDEAVAITALEKIKEEMIDHLFWHLNEGEQEFLNRCFFSQGRLRDGLVVGEILHAAAGDSFGLIELFEKHLDDPLGGLEEEIVKAGGYLQSYDSFHNTTTFLCHLSKRVINSPIDIIDIYTSRNKSKFGIYLDSEIEKIERQVRLGQDLREHEKILSKIFCKDELFARKEEKRKKLFMVKFDSSNTFCIKPGVTVLAKSIKELESGKGIRKIPQRYINLIGEFTILVNEYERNVSDQLKHRSKFPWAKEANQNAPENLIKDIRRLIGLDDENSPSGRQYMRLLYLSEEICKYRIGDVHPSDIVKILGASGDSSFEQKARINFCLSKLGYACL